MFQVYYTVHLKLVLYCTSTIHTSIEKLYLSLKKEIYQNIFYII